MTVKVLIVGHGPSYKNYDFIKHFDGLILSVDASTSNLINNGIIPDYMLFSEVKETLIEKLVGWMPESFNEPAVRNKMKVIYRPKAISLLPSRIGRLKLKGTIYNDKFGNNIANNVGLYSVIFADDRLKPDEIHLIGLDYKGDDYEQWIFTSWIDKTKQYYCSRKHDCPIIDHSNGDFPIP